MLGWRRRAKLIVVWWQPAFRAMSRSVGRSGILNVESITRVAKMQIDSKMTVMDWLLKKTGRGGEALLQNARANLSKLREEVMQTLDKNRQNDPKMFRQAPTRLALKLDTPGKWAKGETTSLRLVAGRGTALESWRQAVEAALPLKPLIRGTCE